MIDCHAHLASPVFDADRSEVLRRAHEAGVSEVLVVGEDAEDDQRVLEVCAQHAVLHPCVGLHPDRFAEDRPAPSAAELGRVCELARRAASELVAVGEVGLDYWYVKTDERRRLQRKALGRMAELARELDVPLNVHSRSAGHHTIAVLEEAGAQRVLMHAFDGKAGHAQRAAEANGWVFSIPPSVVRSAQKQKLVRLLPLEALALESDSPVLGPERRERNEPKNLTLTLRYIAEAKGVSPERVREVTTATARRLFSRL